MPLLKLPGSSSVEIKAAELMEGVSISSEEVVVPSVRALDELIVS